MIKFSLTEFNKFLQRHNQKTVLTESIAGISYNCMVFQSQLKDNGNICFKPYKNTYNIVVTEHRLLFIPIYDKDTISYYESNRIINPENSIKEKLKAAVGLPDEYMYLPYYGTLVYFKSLEEDEIIIYINRRKSHSFETIPYASLVIHCDGDSKANKLIETIKSKHLGAYRYTDETGEHLYDYKGRLDRVYED